MFCFEVYGCDPNNISNYAKAVEFQRHFLYTTEELLKSQNKFKIDNSFGVQVSCTVLPSDVGRKKHVHTEIDWKRFARSTVTVFIRGNLYLLAALVPKEISLDAWRI